MSSVTFYILVFNTPQVLNFDWPLKSIDKSSPQKFYSLFLVVTTGTLALTLVCCAATFCFWCQPNGCTKQLFRVEAAWPFASA